MKRQDILAILRRPNILSSIKDGPVAVMASAGTVGKKVLMVIKQEGSLIIVVVGRIIRHTYKFNLSELTEI